MDRKEKILYSLDTDGRGLEIGPSHEPIAPKKEGYRVDVLDHMNQAQLREKYKDHQVNLNNIEVVDFVWKGQPYAELVGNTKCYDWIIASHVIEHTPDLIGFLLECDSILKDDGVISLIIPDMRYCFDCLRPVTGISKVIDSHLQKRTSHSPGNVAEYFLNVVSRNKHLAWNAGYDGEFEFVHDRASTSMAILTAIEESAYLDIHAWCFVPSAFRLLVHDLFTLDFIPFREACFFPTHGHEFYITLSRQGDGLPQPRMDILTRMRQETGD